MSHRNEDSGSWLFIPPIPTLVMMLTLIPFSDSSSSMYMGATFWLFVALIYLSVSTGYIICLSRKIFQGLFPMQILAQGIALLVLPLWLGAPYGLSWIGLALASTGIIVMVHRTTSALKSRVDVKKESEETETSLSKGIPLPSVDVDPEGNIASVNDEMAKLLDISEDLILGQKAGSLFPDGMDRVEVGGRGWHVLRKPLGGESQLICLVEEFSPPAPKKNADNNDMLHEKSGLFSDIYADIIAPSEIKRSIRYRRWLSMIMIRLSFRYDGSETADKSWEEGILDRYGMFIKRHVRECDMGFFLGKGLFLILLPETPNAGAKIAAAKFKKLPDDIREDLEAKGSVSAVIYTSLYHCSGNEKVDYRTVMRKLEENLTEEEEFSTVGTTTNTTEKKTEGHP